MYRLAVASLDFPASMWDNLRNTAAGVSVSAYKRYNAMLNTQSAPEVAKVLIAAYGARPGPGSTIPPEMFARLDPRLVAAIPQPLHPPVCCAKPDRAQKRKERERRAAERKRREEQVASVRQQIAAALQAFPGPPWAAALHVDRTPDTRQVSPLDTPDQHIEQILSARTAWWTAHREAGTPLMEVLGAHHREFAWPNRLPAASRLVELLTDPETLAAPAPAAQLAARAYLAQVRENRAAARQAKALARAEKAAARERRRIEAARAMRQQQEQRALEQERFMSTGQLPESDRRSWRRLSEVAALVGLSASTVRADLKKGRLEVEGYTRGGYMSTSTSLHTRSQLRAWLARHRPTLDQSVIEHPTRWEVEAHAKVCGERNWNAIIASPRIMEGHRIVPPPGWPPGVGLRLASSAAQARHLGEQAPTATLEGLEQEIDVLGRLWQQVVDERARRAGWSSATIALVRKFLTQIEPGSTMGYQVAWPGRFDLAAARARLEILLSDCLGALVARQPDLVPALTGLSLSDPLTWYPQARALKRRWILHVGPTNSGKTHDAMCAMLAASTGIYLAPLRLMALEGFDRLVAAGKPSALVTGEERTTHLVDGDHLVSHTSATIEAGFDEDRVFDVAVVDEAQMIADPDRGWAWSQALAGIRASQLHVCVAPEARHVLLKLAERLGEPVEVVEHQRLTPLTELATPVKLMHLEKGDALVVFSRRQLMGYRAWLRNRGQTVAVLYGDLGPEVRRAEADRFRNGQADILVSTDAIGMGLNLPIRRVIFGGTDKFDGRRRRPLKPSEWRQIAGRAGRHGLYEEGFYGRLATADPLVRQETAEVTAPWFRPSRALVRSLGAWMGWTSLSEVIRFWAGGGNGIEPASGWASASLVSCLSCSGLPLDEQYRYLGAPVDKATADTLVSWVREHARAHKVGLPGMPKEIGLAQTRQELATLETLAAKVRLYRWCALAFPQVYAAAAAPVHAALSSAIAASLGTMELANLCDACGNRLPVGHPHANCDTCFQASRRQRYAGSRYRWNGYGDYYDDEGEDEV